VKLVIDTNLWVSALINTRVRLNDLILNKGIEIVISNDLLLELTDVLKRNKFRRYFSLEEAENFLLLLQEVATFIEVSANVELCDDPKDNFLLNLAIDSQANFLITGDNDLLRMGSIQHTCILTLPEFSSILNQTNE